MDAGKLIVSSWHALVQLSWFYHGSIPQDTCMTSRTRPSPPFLRATHERSGDEATQYPLEATPV